MLAGLVYNLSYICRHNTNVCEFYVHVVIISPFFGDNQMMLYDIVKYLHMCQIIKYTYLLFLSFFLLLQPTTTYIYFFIFFKVLSNKFQIHLYSWTDAFKTVE